MFICSLQAVILRHPSALANQLWLMFDSLASALPSRLFFQLLQLAFHFLWRRKNSSDTYFQREKHICYHKKYKYLLYFRHINWISIKTFSSPDIGNCGQKEYWLPCTNTPALVLTTLSAYFTYHANTFSKTQSVVCHLHNHCTFTILNSHSITFIRLPT